MLLQPSLKLRIQRIENYPVTLSSNEYCGSTDLLTLLLSFCLAVSREYFQIPLLLQ